MERNCGGVTGSILSAAAGDQARGKGSSGLDGSAFRDLPEESDADTDVDADTTGPDESTVGEDAVGEHKEALSLGLITARLSLSRG